MKKLAALVGAGLALVAGPAGAGTNMVEGFTTSEVADPAFLAASADHGDQVTLVSVRYPGSNAYLDSIVTQVQEARAVGLSPYLRVFGLAADAPLTTEARGDYCAYVRKVADLTGTGRVAIWNEPNGEGFTYWPDTGSRPSDYAKLLLACYPVVSPTARVYGLELAPDFDPARFIAHVGDALGGVKAFDSIATHPYPANQGDEPVDATHPGGRYAVGDYDRLIADATAAFPWQWNVWYTETGWWSSKLGVIEQCRHLYDAWALALEQPRVGGFLNYRWTDDGWWTTGVAGKPSELATRNWQTGHRSLCGTARKHRHHHHHRK